MNLTHFSFCADALARHMTRVVMEREYNRPLTVIDDYFEQMNTEWRVNDSKLKNINGHNALSVE